MGSEAQTDPVMNTRPEFRFGDYRLLPQEEQLLRGAHPVALTARAFALLLALVREAGKLVSKDALMQQVWDGVVVEENNLAVQVGVLRKLLGSDAIATVPGRGYRFALTVHVRLASEADETRRPGSGNLPVAVAPLIGRDADLEQLLECLGRHRLVTVVGAGGIGKSRLALAAGREVSGRRPDGVWWLELAGLGEGSLVVPAVAQLMGISVEGSNSGQSALVAALADRESLLVIDNCEHLLEAVAVLVDRLLAGAPRIRVLATSQEPLRLDAEQQFRLNPLAIPADAATPGAREFGALALLASRVRASQPGFELSELELPLAIDLCRRLDGLPLAIELAAARVPLLGLRTVHDRLDERFRLLTAGSRTALRRHQTLRAAIDWSHALLDDGQREVFMRLSVFSGGFTMSLAQSLCADESTDEWAVLDRVAALVDKSLVVIGGVPGHRYRLLESARAYAMEQLAGARMTPSTLRSHAHVMLVFLRRVDDANLNGELRTDEYAAHVLPELDNLRAAYAWAAGPDGDRDIAFGLAAHVSPLIDYSLEFANWMLGQRPHLAAAQVEDATRARFWRGLAASNMYGYLPMADQLRAAWSAATLYRAMGRSRHLFSSLRRAFAWALLLNELDVAERAMGELEGLVQSDWGPEFRIEVLRGRSALAGYRGAYDDAIALRQDAVRIARDVFGDWRLEVIDATCVAGLLWCAGRLGEASALLGELIDALQQRPASDYELIDAIETRLWILSDSGAVEAAVGLAQEAMPVMRRMPRFSLCGAAHLLMRLGHWDSAARVLGAHCAREEAGLAPSLPPGLSTFTRLRCEVQTALESVMAPAELTTLQVAGKGLSGAEVCDLLAVAIRQGQPARTSD